MTFLSAWCGRYRHLLVAAGLVHLSVVVVTSIARLLPAQGVVLLTLLGCPLYFAWALADYRSFLLATFATIAVVQMEPAPFDMLVPVALAAGVAGRHIQVRLDARFWTLAAFVGLSVVSVARADDLATAIRYVAITGYLALLYLAVAGLLRQDARQAVIAGIVVAALATTALTLLAFYDVPDLAHLIYHRGPRWQGTFKDPNVFGGFLVLPLAWSLDRVMAGGRAGWVLATAVLLLGLVMSLSRGAVLAGAVTLGIMAVLALRRREYAQVRRGAFALALGLAVVVGFVLAHDLGSTILRRVGLEDYDSVRFEVQERAVTGQSGSSRALGMGPGQFEVVHAYATHSLYLRILAENGLLAFVPFGAFLVLHLVRIGPGGGTILAILAGQLLNGFVIDTLHWRHLWVLLGLAAWNVRR
ncbi:MAG: hypothetical protein RDU83_09435 [bacterium]|nr:hypothetical protein [bacterium]